MSLRFVLEAESQAVLAATVNQVFFSPKPVILVYAMSCPLQDPVRAAPQMYQLRITGNNEKV